ncbi:hypothetical protein [Mycoplasma procyoni]|uniref:hypothetical protein n=1 Tax=Mycoplasma procyoni TaxID=568784 RepID=UPI00197C8CD2|nr:hypothetical protein [Mycoplasma procyoni]MBN3534604.1 hypothetical protein [Mycoplasma procyoni]
MNFYQFAQETTKQASNPANYTIFPYWLQVILGVLFILLGIVTFLLYPKAKRKAEEYKKGQLEEYKKLHKIAPATNVSYESTKMYLPAWENFKLGLPIIFGIVFIVIGISFIFGSWIFPNILK